MVRNVAAPDVTVFDAVDGASSAKSAVITRYTLRDMYDFMPLRRFIYTLTLYLLTPVILYRLAVPRTAELPGLFLALRRRKPSTFQ